MMPQICLKEIHFTDQICLEIWNTYYGPNVPPSLSGIPIIVAMFGPNQDMILWPDPHLKYHLLNTHTLSDR